VRREIEVAENSDVIPVVLNLNGALEAAPADAPLAVIVRNHDWLRLVEVLDDPDGEPSDRIVLELVRSFNHTRQETRRQRVFGTAAIILLVTAGLATWQAVAAYQARDAAYRAKNEAEQAKDQAESEKARAERALQQVVGTANRSVQALALRARKTRESSAAAPIVPPCDLAHLKDYDDIAAAALKVRDTDAALGALTDCLAVAQAHADAEPTVADWQKGLATLHQRIGELSPPPLKREHLRQSTLLWRKLAAEPALLPQAEEQLGAALIKLGDLDLSQKKPDAALVYAQEGASLFDRLVSTAPTRRDLQAARAAEYQQIADALLQAGDAQNALIWADKDLAAYGDLSDIAHADPGKQRDIASSYDRRAQALELLGRNKEALALFVLGTSLLESAIVADAVQPDWKRDAAAIHERMGKLLGKMGDPDRAIQSFWRALAIREGMAISIEDPSWLAEVTEAYRRSSELMLHIDRVDEALEMAEQYLLAASINADADKDKATRMRRALGTVCWSATNGASNRKNLERATLVGKWAVDLSPQLDWVTLNYAHALMLSGARDAAKDIYRKIDKEPAEEAKKLKAQVLQDFDTLKRRGYSHIMMAEIQTEWGM
jgi:tetratricopeptide (TPR) repeat protein